METIFSNNKILYRRVYPITPSSFISKRGAVKAYLIIVQHINHKHIFAGCSYPVVMPREPQFKSLPKPGIYLNLKLVSDDLFLDFTLPSGIIISI